MKDLEYGRKMTAAYFLYFLKAPHENQAEQ